MHRTRLVRAAVALCASALVLAAPFAARPAAGSGASIRPTPLNVLWRVDRGGDRITSTVVSERDAMGGSLEGQSFYVPSVGPNLLYRTFNRVRGDHKDSLELFGLPGYIQDGVLGSPWSRCDAAPGLAPIIDGVNPTTGDHATMRPGESLPGYTARESLGCGYPRYGMEGENLLTTTAGGVTVSSNRVAGGSVWRWTHRGVQYVNTFDYGRQIQTAIFIDQWNPTEAGDSLGDPRAYPWDTHGSPLIAESSTPTTQSTRAAPLEFSINRVESPSVYQDITVGKDLTLDFRGMGPVVQYETVVTTSRRLVGDWQTYISAPVAFLRPLFDRYFTYDAATPAVPPAEVFPGDYDLAGISYEPPSGFGGMMIADDSLERAMGMYAVSLDVPGGTIEAHNVAKYFGDFLGPGEDDGEASGRTSALEAHSWQPIRVGTTVYRTWIITGTLDEVAALMTDLYEANVR